MDVRSGCLLSVTSATSPAVSCEALRELKYLLAQAPAAGQRDMVQAEHHPLLRTGGADATPDQPATGRSTRPVSSFSEDATVDAPAAGGPQETVRLLAQLLRQHRRGLFAVVHEPEVRDE